MSERFFRVKPIENLHIPLEKNGHRIDWDRVPKKFVVAAAVLSTAACSPEGINIIMPRSHREEILTEAACWASVFAAVSFPVILAYMVKKNARDNIDTSGYYQKFYSRQEGRSRRQATGFNQEDLRSAFNTKEQNRGDESNSAEKNCSSGQRRADGPSDNRQNPNHAKRTYVHNASSHGQPKGERVLEITTHQQARNFLGLSGDVVSKDELKHAYRETLQRVHPDHGGSHEDTIRANQAYQLLKNLH